MLSDKRLQKEFGGDYDVIVANIVADVIIALAPQVGKLLKKGGIFLCSGIIDDRADEVKEQLIEAGWRSKKLAAARGGFLIFADKGRTAQKKYEKIGISGDILMKRCLIFILMTVCIWGISGCGGQGASTGASDPVSHSLRNYIRTRGTGLRKISYRCFPK